MVDPTLPLPATSPWMLFWLVQHEPLFFTSTSRACFPLFCSRYRLYVFHRSWHSCHPFISVCVLWWSRPLWWAWDVTNTSAVRGFDIYHQLGWLYNVNPLRSTTRPSPLVSPTFNWRATHSNQVPRYLAHVCSRRTSILCITLHYA